MNKTIRIAILTVTALATSFALAADCDYCTAIQGTSPPYNQTLAPNSNDLTKMALLYVGAIADLEETDDNGWTMLHWAVEVVNNENYGGNSARYTWGSGNLNELSFNEQVYQAAKVYMHKRANPNIINDSGETALLRAVAKNDARMVNIILGNEVLTVNDFHFDITARDKFWDNEQNNDDIGAAPYVKHVFSGVSPLMYAVRHAALDVVQAVSQALTDAGGTVDETTNDTDNFGNTALFHYAPRVDNAHIGRALVLADGINLTIVNNAGENILQHAIHHNNVALVSDIAVLRGDTDSLDNFYNYRNADGNSPLMLAAQLGRTAIVNLLINQPQVNPYNINNRGRNAFMEAARFGHVDILRALYDRYGRRNGEIVNPQYSAIDIEQEIDEDYVDGFDSSGASALLAAADGGHSAAVQFLLDIGANPNIQSCLALFLVCRGTGNTPLLYAVRNNDNNTFLYLAQQGVDYNLANNDGITPLILAASLGHRTAAKALLLYRANPFLIDDNGLSALEHARSQDTHNHREIVRLIREIITEKELYSRIVAAKFAADAKVAAAEKDGNNIELAKAKLEQKILEEFDYFIAKR